MMRVHDVRERLARSLKFQDFRIDKSGGRVIDIPAATFLADEPVIFGKINEDWHEREVDWYEKKSLNVNDIEGPVPAIWKQVATEDGRINSNYGYLIYSEENGSQYDNVLAELKRNPQSRRATMVYQRPSIWQDFDADGMSDFICTMGVTYRITPSYGVPRDSDGGQLLSRAEPSRLDAIVQMRSNDLIFGYKGDRYWQQHVLEKLAAELGVVPGDVIWHAASAHVYERHFHLIDFWGRTKHTHVPKKYYSELYPDSPWAGEE